MGRAGLAGLLVLLPGVAVPGLALAEGHAVTVVNRTGETIRQIHISPAGASSAGENRLRSQLPPNAEARITYSTGCKVDVRIGYESGRTEAFTDQDACAELRVAAGQGTSTGAGTGTGTSTGAGTSTGTSTGAVAAVAGGAAPGRTRDVRTVGGKPAAPPMAPVVVPPWTGRSITKRFGGLD